MSFCSVQFQAPADKF